MEKSLDIIWHNKHYLAINKPSGLLVHKSPIDKHETRFALQLLRDQIGQHVYPVHRLDKPTSGVLLFAKSPEAAAAMQQSFSQSDTQKHYLAITRGFTPEQLVIKHPVKAVKDKRLKQTVKDGHSILQRLATTELNHSVDGKYPAARYSLVNMQAVTGRRHQLRYHLKHIAHPIIGDAKYGKSLHNRFFETTFGNNRLLLHAAKLQFIEPYTGELITCLARPCETFTHVCQQLNWQPTLEHYYNAPWPIFKPKHWL